MDTNLVVVAALMSRHLIQYSFVFHEMKPLYPILDYIIENLQRISQVILAASSRLYILCMIIYECVLFFKSLITKPCVAKPLVSMYTSRYIQTAAMQG